MGSSPVAPVSRDGLPRSKRRSGGTSPPWGGYAPISAHKGAETDLCLYAPPLRSPRFRNTCRNPRLPAPPTGEEQDAFIVLVRPADSSAQGTAGGASGERPHHGFALCSSAGSHHHAGARRAGPWRGARPVGAAEAGFARLSYTRCSCTGAGRRCRSPCSRRRRSPRGRRAMPRSPFRRARFFVSFAVRLWMSKPSSPAPLAVLCFRRLWSSFSLTRKPSTRLPLTRFPRTRVVRAAEEGMRDSEADARPAGVSDDVVGDQVAVALLDPDAVAASGDAVSRDHVMAAGTEGDAGVVSNQAVALDPVALAPLHDQALAAVARDAVPLDQAVGSNRPRPCRDARRCGERVV